MSQNKQTKKVIKDAILYELKKKERPRNILFGLKKKKEIYELS